MADIIETIFDVETKSFFDDTGTRDASELGVSIVSVYRRTLDANLKEVEGQMLSFWESEFDKMWPLFADSSRIIGFNTKRFDLPALRPYAPPYFAKLNHFDILEELRSGHGHGTSLDRIAKDTLGKGKNDSGANAVLYWNNGDPESLAKLKMYCEMDVAITRDIYDFVLTNKYLKFTDRWNSPRVVELDFSYPPPEAVQQDSLF